MFAVFELDVVVLGLEGLVDHVREVGEDLVVEVAPDQLAQPGARPGDPLPMHWVGQRSRLPHGEGAKTQVHAQVTGPFDGGEVARLVVAVDALQEIGQQLARAAGPGGHGQLREVGGLEVQVRQARHRHRPLGWHGRERRGVARHRVGLEVKRFELLEPRVLVGCEHAKRVTRLREQLAPLEDHVVLVTVQQDTGVGQIAKHLGVARQRRRIVVVVGEHRLDLQPLGQRGNGPAGLVVQHDEAGTCPTAGLPEGVQVRVELHQRLADEFDAPVRPGQGIQNVGVEDEDAPDLAADLERVVQRCVVLAAQVATEPHQAFVVGVHGGGWVPACTTGRCGGSGLKSTHVR